LQILKITFKKILTFDWTPYDETISKIKKSHSNVTFFIKVMILLDKFPHVKKKSQIISHVK